MPVSAGASEKQEVLARLLKRTAQHDWQAFSLLYSMTSSQLFGLMLSMTNYANVCEDLLQEVYLTVWRKADQYEPDKAAVSTWLCTIARNRTLDWLRSQSSGSAKDRREQSVEALDLACGNTGPDQWTETSMAGSAMQTCLERLSAEQRSAILLAYFEGLTHAELASRLQSALGTVKSWVRRGLESLKICLQQARGEA
jgi:RNA polymerase sigma-70 factor (ECF subfamily)